MQKGSWEANAEDRWRPTCEGHTWFASRCRGRAAQYWRWAVVACETTEAAAAGDSQLESCRNQSEAGKDGAVPHWGKAGKQNQKG